MKMLLKLFCVVTITIGVLMILAGVWMLCDHGLESTKDDTLVTKQYYYEMEWFDLDIRMGDIYGYPDGHIRFLSPEMNCNSFVTPNDPTVQRLWGILSPSLQGMTDLDKANALLRFVQINIDYASDNSLFGHKDYSQYPAETLFTKTGDCEDMAYLLYTLYELADLDAVLVHSTTHTSVGVNVDLDEGYYVQTLLSSARYYIAESVSNSPVGGKDMMGDFARAFKPVPLFSYLLLIAGTIVILLMSSMILGHSRHEPKEADHARL